jgi:cytochrome o ubiquinol oxidase operon protein cyoD
MSGTLKSYFIGFLLSIFLTLAAFYLAGNKVLTGFPLLVAVAALAFLQAIAQLLLFLQLGKETKPRWNLLVLLFMLLIVGIVVIGSLWIMYNLNYRMM